MYDSDSEPGFPLFLLALTLLQGCSGSSSCKSNSPSPQTSPDAGPSLQTIALPPSLASETTVPELSGIAWARELNRYIVVSDDTGRAEDGTRHVPWAFTLSDDGKLDEATLSIAGVQQLDDLEAICPGPSGTFFLTTSHSLTRKGKSPGARRRLLHAQLAAGQLQVLGSVDLTTIRNAEGKGLMAVAGLEQAGPLDIEALAWRQDELLIGLKSPLNAQGEATIVTLGGPAAWLGQVDAPTAAFSRWRALPLCLTLPSGSVCQGISDLAFLPDGSLAITGNAPKGGTADGGGALWLLPANPGAQPRLIRHFPGLKPEGLAVSPDQKSLVAVFDRDQQTPVWTRWPLPL